MTTDNPLRQYFRRPALYLKLPSGGVGYPQGSIDLPENGEIPVFPMTAIDEITSRTPDSLFNGLAIVELIKSCVPNIKDPWYVTGPDLDTILVAIRIATQGEAMEIHAGCPKCGEDNLFDVNLNIILSKFKPGAYNETLKIDNLQIKFNPLNYREINEAGTKQFEIQRAMVTLDSIEDPEAKAMQSKIALDKLSDMALDLIVSTIEYIKTPTDTVFDSAFIREFMANTDKKTYELIRTASLELRKSSEVQPLDVICQHCSHEFKQSLNINVSDFFE